MSINKDAYLKLQEELSPKNIVLVAVSKLKSVEDIKALYDLGHRDFGENYVQELVDKQSKLPEDIRWHFIGHLQANKVKYISPFVHLIHSVDKESLLKEINKQANKSDRVLDVLLQIYIATEETKFGLDESELQNIIAKKEVYSNINLKGIMGMASFSEDQQQVRKEFQLLKKIYDSKKDRGLSIISTGMSNDYQLAIEEGSTMVRIGSLLFGNRNK